MSPNSGPANRQMILHPQRNAPSSLMKKRCKETFAQILKEYEEGEGHSIEWAIITESGRNNKVLLITVLGEHDPFPFRRRNDDSEGESEGKSEVKVQSADGNQGERSKGSADQEVHAGADGTKSGKIRMARKNESKKEEEEIIPIPTIAETYGIPSDENNNGDEQGNEAQIYIEEYPVVGTIIKGELEWMCDDPGYAGYEDKTTYFNKDGLSMVDGVLFFDRITHRKNDVLAELARGREAEELASIAERNAKKAAKKARQKEDKARQKVETAASSPEPSPAEAEDSAERKRERARAKRFRQKQRRELAEKTEAEESKAEEAAQVEALKTFYSEQMGEEMTSKEAARVADISTPAGAMAVAKAQKLGCKIFPATKVED